MGGIEVGNGTTIGDDQVFETPFVTQNALKQSGAAAAGFIIEPLVCTHDLSYVCILHQCLECRQIGFVQFSRPECTAKCLAQARSLRYLASAGPCRPLTTCTPILEVK